MQNDSFVQQRIPSDEQKNYLENSTKKCNKHQLTKNEKSQAFMVVRVACPLTLILRVSTTPIVAATLAGLDEAE